MSEESDNMTKEATRPKTKKSEPKRRRNYEGELISLQGRVDLALKILRKNAPSELLELAVEILEGK